jgi:hypothetical protein
MRFCRAGCEGSLAWKAGIKPDQLLEPLRQRRGGREQVELVRHQEPPVSAAICSRIG